MASVGLALGEHHGLHVHALPDHELLEPSGLLGVEHPDGLFVVGLLPVGLELLVGVGQLDLHGVAAEVTLGGVDVLEACVERLRLQLCQLEVLVLLGQALPLEALLGLGADLLVPHDRPVELVLGACRHHHGQER